MAESRCIWSKLDSDETAADLAAESALEEFPLETASATLKCAGHLDCYLRWKQDSFQKIVSKMMMLNRCALCCKESLISLQSSKVMYNSKSIPTISIDIDSFSSCMPLEREVQLPEQRDEAEVLQIWPLHDH